MKESLKKTTTEKQRDFRGLSHRLLQMANQGLLRIDFMREVLSLTMNTSGCDLIEVMLKEGTKRYLYRMVKGNGREFSFETASADTADSGVLIPGSFGSEGMERLCRMILNGNYHPTLSHFTEGGSFRTGDLSRPVIINDASRGEIQFNLDTGKGYKSMALLPLGINHNRIGLMVLKCRQTEYFKEEEIADYEDVVKTLGIAIAQRRVHVMLRERVKELSCLYGIAKVAARPDLSLEEILEKTVALLPPGWLYPEFAQARIIVDGKAYLTPNFREGLYKQSAVIMASGENLGVVEVIYTEERPELDEGPFLREERSLINAIARELGIIIERKRTAEEKARLQRQLLHADRLATLGQLAAGVAHELNEPLGNILGFAQLSQQIQGLSEQVFLDLEKIVQSSLQARDIIKKLLIFARQTPSTWRATDINQVVRDCLGFFESRFVKEGIELQLNLQSDLPEIESNPAQLNQVLVNLLVNAMQAMPQGGRMTVETRSDGENIHLSVEDTGAGMDDEVMRQIFVPFYTTKDVNQGTGLGLAVVHGIVSSHGGSVRVESEIDRGSRFEVILPISGGKSETVK